MTNISSKSLSLALLTLLIALQCQLWLSQGGVTDIWRLKSAVAEASNENSKLFERNAVLTADVANLKTETEAVAEIARHDLGMLEKGERFYQIID